MVGTRRFSIAGLCVLLVDTEDVALSLPEGYGAFEGARPCDETLLLSARPRSAPSAGGWHSIFQSANNWQLWRSEDGWYCFVPAPGGEPRVLIRVDQDFHRGEILRMFPCERSGRHVPYTLREIDLRLYMNWLATKSDFAMHAAGAAESASGYAFLGPAGAGKSTLAAQLASSATVQVLGEDNVIVRYIDGDFMLYGTPWHTDPRMCSPGGVPLTKLFFLERTTPPGMRRICESEAVQRLILNSFIPFYDREAVNRIMDRMTLLSHQVPCYGLSYELGSDVLSQIRQA